MRHTKSQKRWSENIPH